MLLVKVTAEDIENGVPDNPNHCPIANSLKRMFNNRCTPHVGHTIIELSVKNKHYAKFRMQMPLSATRFARKFDAYYIVEPFEFEIKLDK